MASRNAAILRTTGGTGATLSRRRASLLLEWLAKVMTLSELRRTGNSLADELANGGRGPSRRYRASLKTEHGERSQRTGSVVSWVSYSDILGRPVTTIPRATLDLIDEIRGRPPERPQATSVDLAKLGIDVRKWARSATTPRDFVVASSTMRALSNASSSVSPRDVRDHLPIVQWRTSSAALPGPMPSSMRRTLLTSSARRVVARASTWAAGPMPPWTPK